MSTPLSDDDRDRLYDVVGFPIRASLVGVIQQIKSAARDDGYRAGLAARDDDAYMSGVTYGRDDARAEIIARLKDALDDALDMTS